MENITFGSVALKFEELIETEKVRVSFNANLQEDRQREYIEDQLINGRNKYKFLVINSEAAIGKTTVIINALIKLYHINPSIKTYLCKFALNDI